MKVVRTIKEEKAESSGTSQSDGASNSHVHLVIVSVVEQPLNEPPTQSALALLPLLDNVDTSSILAAPLQMVSESQQYAFQVTIQVDPKIVTPCKKILSLVRSTQDTKTDQLAKGFKLTTTDVEDVLGEGDDKTFTLTAICTLENLPKYRLDPPRSGVQYALISVTSMTQDTFIVDQVQLLSAEEATAATASLK